ncbi:hypothetical protein HYPP_00107 [Hyphomicrobium sp. ghe19]|nr:hypothetical protein HYPP_00107 [Hyphomicrobium sp. ghe19]
MNSAFFNVSGIDPHDGATLVFVWCRNEGAPAHRNVLLGSGHVVGAVGCGRPPGVAVGQFSVTFLLPQGCSPNDIIVTSNAEDSEYLRDVTVTPCSRVSSISAANDLNDVRRYSRPIGTQASYNRANSDGLKVEAKS